MLTHQEVFDKSAGHLLKQMEKSTAGVSVTACYYRGHHGMKCAVGALIIDDVYTKRFENMTVAGLMDKHNNAMQECGLNGTHIELLTDLQSIHDNSEPFAWRNHLKTLADTHNLKFNF